MPKHAVRAAHAVRVGGTPFVSNLLQRARLFSLLDAVTMWTMRVAREPHDEEHPYGHGRVETL
eukprot:4697316-Pyramimonas_sp.AAC.2